MMATTTLDVFFFLAFKSFARTFSQDKLVSPTKIVEIRKHVHKILLIVCLFREPDNQLASALSPLLSVDMCKKILSN